MEGTEENEVGVKERTTIRKDEETEGESRK
jgi:hypothetical protein